MDSWNFSPYIIQVRLEKSCQPSRNCSFLSLTFQMLGGKDIIPYFLWHTISMIAQCSIPVALLVIGAGFYDLLRGYHPSFKFRVEIGAFSHPWFIGSLNICYLCRVWLGPRSSCMDATGFNSTSCYACGCVCTYYCKQLWRG